MKRHFLTPFLPALAAAGLVAIFSTSCATDKSNLMNAYVTGDNLKAITVANESVADADKGRDEICWRIEAGTLNFTNGHYSDAIREFEAVENLFDAYDEQAIISLRAVSAEGLAAFTNPTMIPYRGLCRDRIILPFYKALAYLGTKNESAFRAQIHRLRNVQADVRENYDKFFQAEQEQINKVNEKNQEQAKQAREQASTDALVQNAKNQNFAVAYTQLSAAAHRGYGYFLNPVSLFLSALGSLRDGRFDNARIDFENILKALPNSPLAKTYAATAYGLAGRPVPPALADTTPFNFPLDHDCVYVFFANGQTASLQELKIYFPVMFAIPMPRYFPIPFYKCTATADGTPFEALTIADMDGCFTQEFKDRLPGIITRAVTSTLIKEAAYHASLAAVEHSTMNRENKFWTKLSIMLGGTLYRVATNEADTRTWETLPREFRITQFPMPKNRNVRLDLFGNVQQQATVAIPADARSAIIFINAPSPFNVTCQVLPIFSK